MSTATNGAALSVLVVDASQVPRNGIATALTRADCRVWVLVRGEISSFLNQAVGDATMAFDLIVAHANNFQCEHGYKAKSVVFYTTGTPTHEVCAGRACGAWVRQRGLSGPEYISGSEVDALLAWVRDGANPDDLPDLLRPPSLSYRDLLHLLAVLHAAAPEEGDNPLATRDEWRTALGVKAGDVLSSLLKTDTRMPLLATGKSAWDLVYALDDNGTSTLNRELVADALKAFAAQDAL